MAQKNISANVGQVNDYETGCFVEVVSQDNGTIDVLCEVDGGSVYLELNTVMAARLSAALGREVRESVSECARVIGAKGSAAE